MNALRIFAHGGRRPLAGPSRAVEAAHAAAARPLPRLCLAGPVLDHPTPANDIDADADTTIDLDGVLMRLLSRSRDPHETVHDAFQRKELDLRSLFRALAPAAAAALHRRLTLPCADDPLALAFGRLIESRRIRLLAVLADAPRRAVIHSNVKGTR